MRLFRRIVMGFWLTVPAVGLSILVHVMDPDVGGLSGIGTPTILLSIGIFSLPITTVSALLLWLISRYGWPVALSVGCGLSLALGFSLITLQRPEPDGPTLATAVAGVSGLVALGLGLAVLPAWLVGRIDRHAAR